MQNPPANPVSQFRGYAFGTSRNNYDQWSLLDQDPRRLQLHPRVMHHRVMHRRPGEMRRFTRYASTSPENSEGCPRNASRVPYLTSNYSAEQRGESVTVANRHDDIGERLPVGFDLVVWLMPETDHLAGAAWALSIRTLQAMAKINNSLFIISSSSSRGRSR